MKKIYLILSLILTQAVNAQTGRLLVDSLQREILTHISSGEIHLAPTLNSLLQCYEDQYSAQSTQYADCMMWCAYVCYRLQDIPQAKSLLKQSTTIFNRYGSGPFHGLDSLHEIFRLDLSSEIEYETGREYYALQYAQKSVYLKESFFGSQSEQYLQALLNLSLLYADRGNTRRSNYYHNIGYNTYVEHIRRQFCQRTESERTTYWNEAIQYISKTLDLAYLASGKNKLKKNHFLAESSYNALLLSKGILLNTTIGFEDFVNRSNNKEAIQLLNQKKKLSTSDTTFRQIDSIDYAILEILNKSGHPFQLPHLSITWKDVQDKLQDDDLAIEFYRTRSNEYGAVLLKKKWISPKLVRLENIVDITDPDDGENTRVLLNQALGQIVLSDNSINISSLWHIGRAIWCDAIVKNFPEKDGRIFFSTDGELHVIGIEYLPVTRPTLDENGSEKYYCMADLYDICRLSSTRQLALRDSIESEGNVAVFGGLLYDHEKYQFTDSIDNPTAREGISFLNGTKDEVIGIHEIINKSNHGIHDTLFLGKHGTEVAFKALSARKYNLIHIATHGFFFDYNNTDLFDKYQLGSNPLSYCGLYMAGANLKLQGYYTPDVQNDGFLTALEISTMDFRGLDLVVLSACETAKGNIASDGVFGLQRGFKMAGARSILMSLRKVDDGATKMLMTRFYENLFLRNMSKRQALKEAQDYVRNYEVDEIEWAINQRKKYDVENESSANEIPREEWSNWRGNRHMVKPYQNPYYWASFILLDGLN